MSEPVNPIKQKVEELTAAVQRTNDFLNQTNAAIKQLRAERKRTIAQLNELNGALTAYRSVVDIVTITPNASLPEVVECADCDEQEVVSESVQEEAQVQQ